MITFIRTNSEHKDLTPLLAQLDANLAVNDGDEHAFFAQFNKLNTIKHVVIVYLQGKAVGCGAIKYFNEEAMEIKRVFVSPEARNMGIASLIMVELEKWTLELGCKACVLETGIKQLEAVKLYPKLGYKEIPKYEPYVGQALSICFEKKLP